MPVQTEPPPTWLAPARLAFFTPVREYPALADRKAAALLTANGLMSTVVAFFYGPIEMLVVGPAFAESWGISLALLAFCATAVAGIWLAIEALVWPVTPMPRSLAYFPDIAALPAEEYRRQILGITPEQALRDMLNYNHSIARQCAAKFRLVHHSMNCFHALSALWALILVLVVLSGRH